MFRLNEVLAAFDGEHDMDVNLGVSVGHARKMPLLPELGMLFGMGSTTMSSLTGLESAKKIILNS